MLEPKRHSVDIPISRTLVAIMRSRSLRDPDVIALPPRHPLPPASRSRCAGDDHSGESAESPGCKRHSFSCSYHNRHAPGVACLPGARHGICSPVARRTRDQFLLSSVEGHESHGEDIAMKQESSRSLLWKYRPRSFSDLVGQSAAALSLATSAARREVARLYLFHGPHGTGKTSAARVFGAALNCHDLEERRPCGICEQCTLIFSGKVCSVVEVDAGKLNSKNRISALLRLALAPLRSGYRVFVIDDCQDMDQDAWRSISSSIEEFPDHTVFVMITAEADKLPLSSVPWSHRYRFSKIDDASMLIRLTKICIEERLEVVDDVLSLLARKASGSIRDALVMLDQLTLLGKKISRSMAYELIGDVSDDDLLDLLFLSLSSDAASIVTRARELLRANIDPMQLLAQLANLIMDVLAGRYNAEYLQARNIVVTEEHQHKLRNALEVLSETEKQIRSSKNQSTWLTAALVQLNMGGSCCRDSNAAPSNRYTPQEEQTDDAHSCSASDMLNSDKNKCAETHLNDPDVLERIWKKAVDNCGSAQLRTSLLQDGKLMSLHFHQDPGLAIADVGFRHADQVTGEVLEPITHSLQELLGCNVDIRLRRSAASVWKDLAMSEMSSDEETEAASAEQNNDCCKDNVACSKEPRILSYRTILSPARAIPAREPGVPKAATPASGCCYWCRHRQRKDSADKPRRRKPPGFLSFCCCR